MSDKITDTSATGDAEVPKTEAQLKKEAKRLEKLAKFNAKNKKLAEEKEKSKGAVKKEKPVKKEREVITYTSETAPGEKKDISGDMPASYSPQYVEAAWYSWWEKQGFFMPEYGRESISEENPNGTFMMVIPPPNVTGALHLGHALTNSIQDAIVRWQRMRGATVLWNPGCDHAGIATQVVVERKLKRETGQSRHDLGREKFTDLIWDWRNQKGDTIYEQLRRMGSSYDWTRSCFTMDPKLCTAVTEAFVRMHDKGIIYRSNRLVNWSCSLNSAISDIEVDKVEIEGRTLVSVPGYKDKVEFGVIISFAYKIEGTDKEIVVATTRIETMLGDTAIAVHPDDSRYTQFHGLKAKHPFTNRMIPIVKDEMVEVDFGTGAVKITPAHDQNDYDVGKRHNLPFVTIIDNQGLMMDNCGQFSGMKRFDARKAVLSALKELDLYRDTQDNPMVIPTCSRSKDVIEPLLRPQWYVNCKNMAARAVKAVVDKDLNIIPQCFEKTWFMWLENCRDWCISRQLWWGHRIPAYSVKLNDGSHVAESESDRWVSGRTIEEATSKAEAKFNLDKSQFTLSQDEDVLDTWFSSGIFPFSIFGWPNKTAELEKFYPGSLLETGHDILFFWVARMVMMGLELMDELPFKEIYLHAMIRDKHGEKMSKSKGNVIDPLDVTKGISLQGLNDRIGEAFLDNKEVARAKTMQKNYYPQGIPECGTDAMRFGLLSYTGQSRDINLDVLRIQGYRFFCNKLWNATRFSLTVLGSSFTPHSTLKSEDTNPMSNWILSRLAQTVSECDSGFKNYNFPVVTTACYNFWLYDLCDIYLESLKPLMHSEASQEFDCCKQTLYTCLDVGLRLLAPAMPFLTEDLYQRLPRRQPDSDAPSLCVTAYPKVEEFSDLRNKDLENNVQLVMSIIKVVRSLRSSYQLVKTKTDLYVKCADVNTVTHLSPFVGLIKNLGSGNEVKVISSCSSVPSGCIVSSVSGSLEVYLMLKGLINVPKELCRIKEKEGKLVEAIKKIKTAMTNKDYNEKVPESVQLTNTDKVQEMTDELQALEIASKNLNELSEE